MKLWAVCCHGAGQVLLHNLMQVGNAALDKVTQDAHMFSAYLMIPLAATTLALLCFNW